MSSTKISLQITNRVTEKVNGQTKLDLAMVQLLVGIVGRVHLDQATPPSQGPVEVF